MNYKSTYQLAFEVDDRALDDANKKIEVTEKSIVDLDQREIQIKVKSIESDIESINSNIEQLENRNKSLRIQRRKNYIRDVVDLVTLEIGAWLEQLDVMIGNMFRSNIGADFQIFLFEIIKHYLERSLEAGRKGIKNLTDEQIKAIENNIKLLNESIEQLKHIQVTPEIIKEDRVLRSDPLQFEINKNTEEIEKLKQSIETKKKEIQELIDPTASIEALNRYKEDLKNYVLPIEDIFPLEQFKNLNEEVSKELDLNDLLQIFNDIDPIKIPVEKKITIDKEGAVQQIKDFENREGKNRGIEKKLDIDTEGAINSIKDFNKQGEAVEEQLENVETMLTSIGNNFPAGLKVIKDTTINYKELNNTVENVAKTYGVAAQTTKDAGVTLQNLTEYVAQNTGELKDNEDAINEAAKATREWTREELEEAARKLEEINKRLKEQGFDGLFFEYAISSGNDSDQVPEDVKKSTEEAKGILDEFGVYAANVVANISQNFGDLIFETLKGNFDSLSDFWDATMDSILKSFSDLVAAIASKPIIYLLQPKVQGGGAGAQGGGGAKGLAGLFDIGQGFKTIGSGLSKIPGVSGIIDSVKGLFGTGGALAGLGKAFAGIGTFISSAIPVVGAIVSVALPLVSLIKGFLKKKPRLDLDFDSIKTEAGRRAAFVKELLDEDFFLDEIAQISVKRKAGLGVGGDEKIKELLQETLQQAADNVLEIINRLPSELAETLREQLSNTQLDIDTVIKGERFLEFDAKGKEIKKKFEQFINGELQAKFLFAIDDFLQGAFESLGVLPEAASEFLAGRLEDFKNTSSREERAAVGQQLLEDFSAFVDAFNIIEGNAGDSITAAINSVKSLADTLGFEGVPSVEEFNAKLRELLNNVELDASTVQDFVELRNAIIALRTEIVDSVINIIGVVDQLNSTIVSIGGTAVDTTGYMNQAIDSIQGALEGGGLSLSEREGLLGQLNSLATGLLQAEQAAAQAAAEARAQAQRRGIESQIAGLEREKDLIEENFDTRIEALQEELRLAEEFASLTESIRETLRSIVFSAESVFTTVEQINMLQGELVGLQQELAVVNDPERQIEIARRMEDAFKTLFDLAGDAFGVNSPEFVAIFEQVTGGLSSLAEFTENASRSVEEINAEIERLNAERNVMLESIDLRIEALQDRLSAIGSQNVQATFQASERVQELFEFMRNEAIAILEERLAQLEELEAEGIRTEIEGLQLIADFNRDIVQIDQEQLTVLKDIKGALTNIPQFMTGGYTETGGLARLHPKELILNQGHQSMLHRNLVQATKLGELVATPRQQESMIGGEININVNVNGGSSAAVAALPASIEDAIVRSINKGGKIRGAIQKASKRTLN